MAQGHPRWPARRTVALVGVLMVMFVAGIAAVGVVHQTGWLLTSNSAWGAARPVVPDDGFRGTSFGNLGPFGIGGSMASYVAASHRLPATQYDAQGHALHSWQTVLLPYLWRGSRTASLIDYERPWDDPRNAAYFRGIVPDYVNPEIAPIRNREGYALSHFAGNQHVLGARQPLRMSGLSEGASNLILAGEVADGFKAWGDPTNLRDPVRGSRGTPESFGNPSRTGAAFLFGDGSVRFLSKTTSPEVLGRFSVPAHHPNEAPQPDPEERLGVPRIAL